MDDQQQQPKPGPPQPPLPPKPPAKRRRGVGRPKLLADAKVRGKILSAIRDGVSLHDAAAQVGVNYSTLNREMHRDAEFSDAVKKAEIDGKIALIRLVRKGAKADPKWAAWMLERKYYDEYAKRNPDAITAAQLSLAVNRFITAVLEVVPDEFHPKLKSEVERMLENLFVLSTARSADAS